MKKFTYSGVLGYVVALIALSGALTVHDAIAKSPKHLLFHAGAGQRASLDEIAGVFQQRHPDLQIDFSYKGSGFFLADISISKEGDLYMPGEEFYLLQAQKRGFIAEYNPETDRPAYFVTVIITPKGNPQNIHSVADFAKPGLRVGLGDSKACAIGLWHERIFMKAGIWDKVKKNATMNAKCIAELGNACQLKAIDATIVWASSAMLYLKDVDIIPMEPEYRGLVKLSIGTLKFSRYPKEAEELKAFILSDEGREIFHRHAYCINPDSVDTDMKWLVAAVKAARDPTLPLDEQTVGPLVKEVKRQRETKK
jgi:molybdate transport system substrate-binding protein